MLRASSALLISLWLAAPAFAQTQAEGQMRLYIQDLEERVRQLTGENERLTHEVDQLRAELGMPPRQDEPAETGAVNGQNLAEPPAEAEADAGDFSVSPDDPLVAPDGAGADAPTDLSELVRGSGEELLRPEFGNPNPPRQEETLDTAGLPRAPSDTTALSGSARDEYDLAYGYILTGDYDLAEQSFANWLAAFPGDARAVDARFWLGESHLQQREYREAASAFLAVYKSAPDSNKGPDALLKLGVALAALGEKEAACATFAEVGRKYPGASEALMGRVHGEEGRAGC